MYKMTKEQQITKALKPFLANVGMLVFAGTKNTESFREFEDGETVYIFNNETTYCEKKFRK